MKKIIVALSMILGFLIGFFGVFVSVFADGPFIERIISITVILIIYLILSFTVSFFSKDYIAAVALVVPGLFFLLFYTISEFNFLYLIYIVLLVVIPLFGSRYGQMVGNKRLERKMNR